MFSLLVRSDFCQPKDIQCLLVISDEAVFAKARLLRSHNLGISVYQAAQLETELAGK